MPLKTATRKSPLSDLPYTRIREIAALARYTPQHVHRVLKGETRATLDSAVRIAAAAGVTVDEMVAYIYDGDVVMQEALERIAGTRSRTTRTNGQPTKET